MADKKKANKKAPPEPPKKDSKALEAEIQAKIIAELRIQIKEDKERIEILQIENQALDKQHKDANSSTQEKAYKIEKQMTTEEEKKNTQDIQMGQLSKTYEEEKQSLINKHREELEEFEAVKQEDVKKLENKIQIVKADLNSLQQFKQEKTEKEKELNEWQQKFNSLNESLKNDKVEAEKVTIRKVQSIKDKYEKEVNDSKKNAFEKALQDIGAPERKIHQLNENLRGDINLQMDEAQYLKTQQQKIEEDTKGYKRDMLLNMEKVDGYAKRQADLSKKIKELKYELQLKNQALKDFAKEFEKDKELNKYKYESKISELENENYNLTQQLNIKVEECRNTKALSQIILDHRTEVETFFLEALEQVKEESRRKRSNSKKDTSRDAREIKIELKDLELEDRERILRLLFAKMNAGVAPPNWRESQGTSKIINNFEPAVEEEPNENEQEYEEENEIQNAVKPKPRSHGDYNRWAVENNE